MIKTRSLVERIEGALQHEGNIMEKIPEALNVSIKQVSKSFQTPHTVIGLKPELNALNKGIENGLKQWSSAFTSS